MVGTTVSHYTILAKLGEGGMGVVYKAEDMKLQRTVALKFLPPNILPSDEDRQRFVREAHAFAAISHPNIATVFDIEESETHTFIALEFIEGDSLHQKLRSGPLKLQDAIGIAIQVSHGLQAAHENGIVHRDIKSQNIMVTPRGAVKILDFGLASLRGTSVVTRPGTTLGTMGYMSPEQLRGNGVDHRTDIWSLGVVIYEMVAGRRPFQGEFEAATAYQTLNEEPYPLTALRTGVPKELERVVNKLLSKSPANRYQSVTDLLVDLNSLRDSLVTGIRPDNSHRRPSSQRIRALLYGVSAILSLMLVWIGFHLLGPDKVTPITSLAVLPLENLSRDPEQNYFADGMTEAIIVELSQINALKVTSRSSSMRYKIGQKTLPEMARDLNVQALIEGSVQRSGDKVGITVRLIDARTDRNIWSSSSERDLRDILTLEREVAHRIANEIRIVLTPEEEARLTRKTEVNPDAYQLYLKGRYFWDKRSGEDDLKAIESFRHAIAIDPMYGRAYAGLADCYLFQAPLARAEALPAARAAALRALQIDSTLSEAHTTLGFVSMNYDWDWNRAERELKLAIELNPNYPVAHQFYGGFLVFTGRADEGFQEVRRALELDPLSLALNWYLGLMYYLDRRFEQAVLQYKKTLELQPDYLLAINGLSDAYIQLGLYAEAESELGKSSNPEGRLLILYAASKREAEATKKLQVALRQPGHGGLTSYDIAKVYLFLGERNRAMEWLTRGFEERAFGMFFLKVDPSFDPLRPDPRYAALLTKLGFK